MSVFRLPDLGEGLAEAEILEWHVEPGQRVCADQPMVSVETAKAVVEVPVPFAGTVTALRAAVGAIVATGAPLIEFDAGTVVGTMPATVEEIASAEPAADAAKPSAEHAPHDRQTRLRAVPVARALANRLGLELSGITGSGRAGLILLDDVIVHAGLRSAPATRPSAIPLTLPDGAVPEPLRGARRAMAHSMSASRDQVSGSTVCDDADIHAWRRQGDYMPRLIRAMGAACRAEPALNAWYDSVNQSRILFKHVDLAVAVDTPGGLMVPVLRDVQGQSLDALRSTMAAHKAAAHRRSSTPEDLTQFTLMLSNFGTLAGRYGVPLVVPPAVAILGAGKVRQEAVVVGDAVVAHHRIPLSLSFDHRCITGGEACRFLAAVIEDLEKLD
jgi:pyruvate dehydrogenase E2 component (dihydrolipoamide acetyltransferase)